jgi:tRNA pseudouridine55 synthase
MDGILNINKPRGRTSFSIVSLVRRRSGEKRVGHAGTLDPAASGVLPVCLGQGTRISEFLMDETKTYHAEIELGTATDTYDAEGQVTFRADPSGIGPEQIRTALSAFSGLVQQVPPMYSALKHRGKPLYKLARDGITVDRKSRTVNILSLELTGWEAPVATVEVVCGRGTYIRSLAHDLGQALGCGAYLRNLERTRCGQFEISDALTLPQLEEAFRHGYWEHFVYPPDAVLSHWAAVVVDDAARNSIRNGQPVKLEDTGGKPPDGKRSRAYALDGDFLGVLRFDAGKDRWQPEKVFF